MAPSEKLLHRRADGFVETSSGDLAAVMLVSSGQNEKQKWFNFRVRPTDGITRIEWSAGEKLSLFPSTLTKMLVSRQWARHPTDDEIQWYEDQHAPKKAPRKKAKQDEEPVEQPEN